MQFRKHYSHAIIWLAIKLITLLILPFVGQYFVYAQSPLLGIPLAPVDLSRAGAGKLSLENDAIVYRPWNSAELTGKVRTLYHLAARLGADKINAAYFAELEHYDLPAADYATLTILNIDDAFFATENYARHRFEESRRQYPNAEFVLDDASKVSRAWQLQPKSSAIILLDRDGKVLRFKDGALSLAEIHDFIAALTKAIEDRNASETIKDAIP